MTVMIDRIDHLQRRELACSGRWRFCDRPEKCGL